jgi:hypothetical protein
MNTRNLMMSGASRAYYAPDGAEGGDGGDVADPSILGDAGAEQTPEQKAAADAAAEAAKGGKEQTPEEKAAADAAAAEAAKGAKEQTPEEKAAAEAALAAPFENLKAPEGFESLDGDLLAAATPIMRGQLGIDTPEKAQAFVDAIAPVFAQGIEKAVTARDAAAQEAISTEVKGWVDKSKAEFKPEDMAHAARFRDRFAQTQEQKDLIRSAPIFNHPLVVKMFVDGGKALAEDGVIQSDHSSQTGPKTLGGTLYGDMKPVQPAD